MATVASPYGLYVRKCSGARRNTAGNTHYPVPANVTGAMYYGAPVTFIAGGGVGPMAASPSSAAPVVGLVQGATWISSIRPEWFPSLPGGTYAAGGRNIWVMVNDDPSIVMMVQATAAVDYTKVGFVGALVNFATGNNSSGRAVCALDAASLTATGDKAVRVIGINTPGDPFPDVLVQWNANVHLLQGLMNSDVPLIGADAVDPEEQQRDFEELLRQRIEDQRANDGLPPLEDMKRPGETERQYADRMEATKGEREERDKWRTHEREERERKYDETDEQYNERQKKLSEERELRWERQRGERRLGESKDQYEARLARQKQKPAKKRDELKPEERREANQKHAAPLPAGTKKGGE